MEFLWNSKNDSHTGGTDPVSAITAGLISVEKAELNSREAKTKFGIELCNVILTLAGNQSFTGAAKTNYHANSILCPYFSVHFKRVMKSYKIPNC